MRLFLLFALLLYQQSTLATETQLSAYIKTYFVAQQEIDYSVIELPTLYQSQNSGRFMLDIFSDKLIWQIHFEPNIEFNSSHPFELENEPNTYRFSDIQSSIGDEDKKSNISQNLDRFNLQLQ